MDLQVDSGYSQRETIPEGRMMPVHLQRAGALTIIIVTLAVLLTWHHYPYDNVVTRCENHIMWPLWFQC